MITIIEPLRVCRYCNFIIYEEKDLDLFVKRAKGKYGRDNLCRNCANERKNNWRKGLPVQTLPTTPYRRKCRACGLEAWTDADLTRFQPHKRMRHDRNNLCKKCFSERRKKTRDRTREIFNRRQKELISGFPKPILCYFCGNVVHKLHGGGRDPTALVIHSLDGNHNNWDPPNKTPSHKNCHTSHHSRNRSPEVMLKLIYGHLGEKNPAWHGDNASRNALKSRRSKARKREKRINELLKQIEENKHKPFKQP